MSNGKLHRIVLTGGPCAGKTTALAHAREHLEKLGIKTFIVPEVATLVINGGIRFDEIDETDIGEIQAEMMKVQHQLEDTFMLRADQALHAGYDCAIISDRGAMDYKAYMPERIWRLVLDLNAWNVIGLRDRRYDAVIHMVTAANGAEEFYTLANNTARSETPAVARELDDKILKAWLGHPHLLIIPNKTDFKTKITSVTQALSRVVGIPEPLEIERKFLVRQMLSSPKWTDLSNIEQVYLAKSHRIRQRGIEDHYAYTETAKVEIKPGVRNEYEAMIAAKRYYQLKKQAPEITVFGLKTIPFIEKTRMVFVWDDHVFELDRFNRPCEGLMLLECETAAEDTPITLPPYFEIEKEVTNDPAYSNSSIAFNRAVPFNPTPS